MPQGPVPRNTILSYFRTNVTNFHSLGNLKNFFFFPPESGLKVPAVGGHSVGWGLNSPTALPSQAPSQNNAPFIQLLQFSQPFFLRFVGSSGDGVTAGKGQCPQAAAETHLVPVFEAHRDIFCIQTLIYLHVCGCTNLSVCDHHLSHFPPVLSPLWSIYVVLSPFIPFPAPSALGLCCWFDLFLFHAPFLLPVP